ncbi:MAG: hypothetical protein RL172_2846 [Bacteroidota bacterium]|jgi:copper chaperone CopZ
MKKILLPLLLLITTAAVAQVSKATLQASGLTCSMCSNAINKSLKSLDFVDQVQANIKQSTFDISFKTGSNVDFDIIKKKVEDAGFFVASFTATLQFNNATIANDEHIQIDNTQYHFLNVKNQVLNGEKTIKLLDKGFVTSKVFKQNSKYTLKACYSSGSAASCCEKDGFKQGTRIYHVTM